MSVLGGTLLAALFVSCPLIAQEQQQGPDATNNPTATSAQAEPTDTNKQVSAPATQTEEPEIPLRDDRLLYTLPNYLTVENQAPGSLPPLRTKDKFKLVAKDSFDVAEYPFLGLQAGIAESTNSPASLKPGFVGYTERYGIAFADNTIGNFMTEAVFPSMLHQDPRYYQKGHGGFFRRFAYTVSRSFVTRGDSGQTEFNFSEIGGNAVAAGISNLYYPAGARGWVNSGEEWGMQIGWDTAANLLREFWPDMHRLISHKHAN